MSAPRVEVLTAPLSVAAGGTASPNTMTIPLQVLLSGATRAVYTAFPRHRGPPVLVRQASSAELASGPLAGRQLPLLAVDGRVVLEGGAWTESAVTSEVLRAFEGLPPSARAQFLTPEGQKRVDVAGRKAAKRRIKMQRHHEKGAR